MSDTEVAHSNPMSLEKHYKIGEIAEAWNMAESTVKQIFKNEPGVLTIGLGTRPTGRRHKYTRHYVSLRIPESVFLRVYQKLVNKRPGVTAEIRRGHIDRRELNAG